MFPANFRRVPAGPAYTVGTRFWPLSEPAIAPRSGTRVVVSVIVVSERPGPPQDRPGRYQTRNACSMALLIRIASRAATSNALAAIVGSLLPASVAPGRIDPMHRPGPHTRPWRFQEPPSPCCWAGSSAGPHERAQAILDVHPRGGAGGRKGACGWKAVSPLSGIQPRKLPLVHVAGRGPQTPVGGG